MKAIFAVVVASLAMAAYGQSGVKELCTDVNLFTEGFVYGLKGDQPDSECFDRARKLFLSVSGFICSFQPLLTGNYTLAMAGVGLNSIVFVRQIKHVLRECDIEGLEKQIEKIAEGGNDFVKRLLLNALPIVGDLQSGSRGPQEAGWGLGDIFQHLLDWSL
jgi:hypothetical protein